MRVCYFLPWYSPAIIGGTEIYLVNLARSMQAAGAEVTIICPSKGADAGAEDAESFLVAGIPVIATPFIKVDPPGKKATGGQPPDQLQEFRGLLKELDPHILHFHGFWQKHIFYLEAAREMKIRTVVTPHLSSFTCLRGDLMFKDHSICDGSVSIEKCSSCLIDQKSKGNRLTERSLAMLSKALYGLGINANDTGRLGDALAIPFAVKNQLDIFRRIDKAVDAVVALSPWYKKVLVNNGFDRNKVRLIRTSPEKHRPDAVPVRPSGETLRIVFVGRQTYEKGFHLLLDAISRFAPAELSLSLFGKVYEETLEKKIASLQTKGFNIEQGGELSHSQLLQRLEGMDVLCLPSTCVEMAPMVVQEAFAAGIPVIGARLGGIQDAIRDGENGFLFNPNDADDLTEKIARLLREPDLLGTLKQTSAFSFEVVDISGLHSQLYSELIA